MSGTAARGFNNPRNPVAIETGQQIIEGIRLKHS